MTTKRNRRRRQVAVIGGDGIEEGSEAWTLAGEVGRGLAEAGVTVVREGGGGVKEAVSRAAASGGRSRRSASPA
jgi:predicted Rossmann-fold nucleotide-binding protein